MKLTQLVLLRPVLTLMVVAGVLIAGLMALRSSRVELNPDISLAYVVVATPYPGAGPAEVDSEVSRRIEDAISGASGLRTVSSSSQEGVSVVTAEFQIGTNSDKALEDVRARIDKIAGEFPKEVKKSTLDKVQESATPVMSIALKSARLTSRELRTLTKTKLVDRLRKIPGVARVSVDGGQIREIQVELISDRMVAAGVGVLDVQRQLQAASANIPAGQLQHGASEFGLRVPASLEMAQQLESLPITIPTGDTSGRVSSIPLGQIADITDGTEKQRAYSRLSGSDTVSMGIQRSKEGNSVEIAAGVTQELAKIKADYSSDGIDFSITDNQADEIQNSLKDLSFDIWFAVALVCGTIYLFLHNLRGAAIVAVAIPICLVTSILMMRAFGVTINTISMIGLTLAIAVLVDDAIVVLENIFRHLKAGEDPMTAALKGRSEIGMAAIAITLADVVVFLPIAFIGGIVGLYLRPLAIAFVSAVLVSLLVSFTITPLLASRWFRAGEDLEHPTGRFSRWFEAKFDQLTGAYGRGLNWALNHRWTVFLAGNSALAAVITMILASSEKDLGSALQTGLAPAIGCAAVGLAIFVVQLVRRKAKVSSLLGGLAFGALFLTASAVGYGYGQWKGDELFKFAFLPSGDASRLAVDIKLAPGSSLAETDKVVRQVEAKLIGQPDIRDVIATIGSQNTNIGANFASLDVLLRTKASPKDVLLGHVRTENLRTRSSKSVAFEIQQRLPEIAGANIRVRSSDADGFGAPIQVSLTSVDLNQLQTVAGSIVARLQQGVVAGITNPESSIQAGKKELRLNVDRDRLAQSGLDVANVGEALRTLYEGDDSLKIRKDGSEYSVRLQLAKADRTDREALASVPLSFTDGTPILLDSIGSISEGQSTSKVERRNGSIQVTVSADLLPGYSAGTVQAKFDEWLASPGVLPAGVTVKALGQADFQNEEAGGLIVALLIGVTLVYMLLASLYENLVYPFIIQLCQPQAMVGALLALVLTDTTFDIVGFIGLIALVGLVGKNAILLVDNANARRAEGTDRHQALVASGESRLRPILMTTLALILGILPIALALGRGGEARAGIGVVIIGGTMLSTILTLFVIPCSYTIIDDFAARLGRRRVVVKAAETSLNP